ncbi:DUF2732 family protein, partial [Xenorhabdus bovienii]
LKTGNRKMNTEQLIKINREDERKILAGRSASRLRTLSSYMRANRMNYVAACELLDSEAEKIEHEAQELNHV